ncbi:MAG: hypothetical protein WBM90_09680 [Acidimicrobiia bacterium]
MPGEVRIVEDGLEQSVPARPDVKPWVWMLVGLLIGIGFAVVFFTPTSADSPIDPVEDALPDLAPVRGLGEAIGISEAVPGFHDALVAINRTDAESLEHVLWPIDKSSVTQALPVGAFGESEFDSMGTWMATTTRVPDIDEMVLYMGKPSGLTPLVDNVTSFQWHDTRSALLAYTRFVDGQWTLWTTQSGHTPEEVSTGLAGGEVAAWGDWGYAIQGEDDNISLLTPEGDLKTTARGRILGSHPAGWIAVHDGELRLLSAGGGLNTMDLNLASIGGAVSAAISPDLEKLAVIGTSGLKVAPIQGGGETVEVPLDASIGKVSWSSDSRFVLVPLVSGVKIVDVVDVRTYDEMEGRQLVEVSVIPLTP